MQSDTKLSEPCSGLCTTSSSSSISGQQHNVEEVDMCDEKSVCGDSHTDNQVVECQTECCSKTSSHVDSAACPVLRLSEKCKPECKHETEKKQYEMVGEGLDHDQVSKSAADHVSDSGNANCVNYSCSEGVEEHYENDVEDKNSAGITDHGEICKNGAGDKERTESCEKDVAGDDVSGTNSNIGTGAADGEMTESESDSDLSLSDTVEGAASEADDDSVTAGQHSLSGPQRRQRTSRRQRQSGASLRRITLPESMMPQWRAVGRQWGLHNDDDIARILIRHYEDIVAGRPPRGPLRPRCQDCGEVLMALPCGACGPNQHSNRLSHDQDSAVSSKKGDSGRSRD